MKTRQMNTDELIQYIHDAYYSESRSSCCVEASYRVGGVFNFRHFLRWNPDGQFPMIWDEGIDGEETCVDIDEFKQLYPARTWIVETWDEDDPDYNPNN